MRSNDGRRAVEHRRAEPVAAAGLLDQPALEQAGDDGVGGDAADAGDLGPPDRLQVGDHGERLERRGAEPALGRARLQAAARPRPGRPARRAGRSAPRDALEHDAARRARRGALAARRARARRARSSPRPRPRARRPSSGSPAHEQQRLADGDERVAHATASLASMTCAADTRSVRLAARRRGSGSNELGLAGARLAALDQLEQRDERGRLRAALEARDLARRRRSRRARARAARKRSTNGRIGDARGAGSSSCRRARAARAGAASPRRGAAGCSSTSGAARARRSVRRGRRAEDAQARRPRGARRATRPRA